VFVVDTEFARKPPELLHDSMPAIARRRVNLENSVLFSLLWQPHRASSFIAPS
jgi:hypothetical protein